MKGWFWVGVKGTNRLNAHTGEEPQAPAFITLQGLATFPGASLAVTVIWVFLNKVLGVDDDLRNYVVSIGAAAVGLILLVWGWGSLTSRGEKWGSVGIAIINSMYLALIVLGIDVVAINGAGSTT